MKKILFIISVLFTTTVFAQYTITMDAYVLDADSKQPIPYVNIQCVGKDIKTITDASGKFMLSFDEEVVNKNDTFQFITLGYDSLTVDLPKLTKYLTGTNKIYLNTAKKSTLKNTISGTVFNEEKQSIQNAVIRIKDTFIEAQTNVDGAFTIPAKIGDVLVVDFIGMNSYEVLIKDEKPINITLITNGELLDAVLLEGRKEKVKKRYVDTGFGKVNLASFGIGSVIKSEDIGWHRVNITDILSGRIAGLQISSIQGNSGPSVVAGNSFGAAKSKNPLRPGETILKLRGKNALIFYDGNPFYGDINDLNVNTIDNIAIVRSLSRTVLYGGKPAILITSKNRFIETDANGKVINSALATGNDYEESVPLLSNMNQSPKYLVELQKATSYNEALEIYNTQSQSEKLQTVPYYIDASEYFMKWNTEKAISILKTIENIAGNNPKALKGLAYKLEELKQYEQAKLIYQRIAILLPNAAQSYRDLALIYKSTGDYQKSMDLYVAMLTNKMKNVDFSGLEKPLLSELQHLTNKYRSKIDYKELPSNLLVATFKYDVRIVFEWNDPMAEFELQFVNPNRKSYAWEHSVVENNERMLDEVKKGYHTEEFIIDEAASKGEWIINIKSKRNETPLNPTYIKYTIYKNYGAPNEEKQVKLVKLYKQQQKVTLDKIHYQSAQ